MGRDAENRGAFRRISRLAHTSRYSDASPEFTASRPMTGISRLPVLNSMTALALLCLAAALPAQRPQLAWTKETMTISAGLNNGLRKMALAVHCDRRRQPFCRFMMRALGKDTDKELFRDFMGVPAKKFRYRGTKKVKNDEVDADLHEFTIDSEKVGLEILFPVRAIGGSLAAHFKRHRFDFDEKRLPFVIVMARAGGKRTPYPLRDMSGFENPPVALMTDVAPLEVNADRKTLLDFLLRKLGHAEPKKRLEAVEQLRNFSRAELAVCVTSVLTMRSDDDPEVAKAAKRLCKRHKWYSRADITKALADLQGEKPAAIRRALLLLRDLGPTTRHQSEAPLRKLLQRKDLAQELQDLVKQALAAVTRKSS